MLDIDSKELIGLYQQLMTKTLHKLLLYEDETFLAKMMPFLTSLIEKHAELLEYEQILDLIKSLIQERWSDIWRVRHAKNKDPPIWLVTTHESVRLAHTLAEHPESPSCSRAYGKLLVIMIDLLGRKPTISP
jgi:hypothetical protein